MQVQKKIRNIIIIIIFIIVIMTTFFSGCVKTEETYNISIAQQFGLAYAPVQIMKEMNMLENSMPEINVNWKQLGNTAAIREAMLSGEVDIGFMAIPPFLIGWDKGMEWKISSGLSFSPLGLITNKEEIKSLKDFSEDDKIALPQPGSIQHILLTMACERELKDASKLDNNIVTMAHPDGMSALIANKEVTAHFTSPPYLFKELEMEGMHQILSGKEAFGKDFTFIVGVTTKEFFKNNSKEHKAFTKSLNQAIDFINNNPCEAVEILSPIYNIDEDLLYEYLSWEGVLYSNSVKGIEEFAEFMLKSGYIDKIPKDINEVMWEEE